MSEKNRQYYTIYCIPTFGPPCVYIYTYIYTYNTQNTKKNRPLKKDSLPLGFTLNGLYPVES